MTTVTTRIGRVLCAVSLAMSLEDAAAADPVEVVVKYNSTPSKDFLTTPYYEKGVTTTVNAGHYEFYEDPDPVEPIPDPDPNRVDDRAFNLDDENLGLSRITITVQGLMFDVKSLQVINPADPETGESYTISAVGGGGGSVPAPGVAGPLTFGAGFKDITALVITQNTPGAFTFDDLRIQSLPEPSAAASLFAGALAVAALRRRTAR